MWFWSILFVLLLCSMSDWRFFVVLGAALWGAIAGDGAFWNWFVGTGLAVGFLLSPILWAWFGGGFYLGKNGFTFPWNLK